MLHQTTFTDLENLKNTAARLSSDVADFGFQTVLFVNFSNARYFSNDPQ